MPNSLSEDLVAGLPFNAVGSHTHVRALLDMTAGRGSCRIGGQARLAALVAGIRRSPFGAGQWLRRCVVASSDDVLSATALGDDDPSACGRIACICSRNIPQYRLGGAHYSVFRHAFCTLGKQ